MGFPNYHCSCDKQHDFLNWFHHIHFSENKRVDFCTGQADPANQGTYLIKPCSCKPIYCGRPDHIKREVVYAVNTKVLTVSLHLPFIYELKDDFFTVTLSKRCPKNKGWYHLNFNEASYRVTLMERVNSEIRKCRLDVESVYRKLNNFRDALSAIKD